MKFTFTSKDWSNIIEGEKNCYLLTNGLGGFSSLSIIGAAARGDQALLMAAKVAPNVRWHLVTNVLEKVIIDDNEYIITSQRMKDGNDLEGYKYLTEFAYETIPTWTYKIDDVVLTKTLVMTHEKNEVAINYNVVENNGHAISLEVTPLYRFTPKNNAYSKTQVITRNRNIVECDDYKLNVVTNGFISDVEPKAFGPMYFSQDERDGRQETGCAYIDHKIVFYDELVKIDNANKLDLDKTYSNKINSNKTDSDMTVIFTTDTALTYHAGIFNELVEARNNYDNEIINKANVTSKLGKQLAISADAYLVNRESTNGKTIIAGYPFFEDWGRDTMIALGGVTLVTGRYDECKSILRTFAKYVKNGLLPNLFPEGGIEPMYNSVDAPLLFINSVYEYITYSKDKGFLSEIYPKLVEIIEGYKNGTGYHIGMDDDYLIKAGEDLEQLTWMDVRVGDHLPTPRHGKPVEINAYWYNALCVMAEFSKTTDQKNTQNFLDMAEMVKTSFLSQFWNEDEKCLRDVLNGTYEETQVRCNQVWTMSLPFTMLEKEQERMVLEKIKNELYTTVGLRTLTSKDPNFHEVYIGDMVSRDKAYHQGTVWAFPLGAYYRDLVRFIKKYPEDDHTDMINHIKDGFAALEDWLQEGCVNQIAEIYDGKNPTVSRGCFAQAWSVGELLRAVYDFEQM